MTENVAYLLLDLLRTFKVPAGRVAQTVRGFDDGDDLQAWRNHVHGFRLVEHVAEAIDYLEVQGTRVNVYRKHLPSWYAGVGFGERTPWGTDHHLDREVCSEASLDTLENLGSALDGRETLVLDESDAATLLEVVAEAQSLVEGDPDLTPELRSHLRHLLREAKFYLDHLQTYGADSVREVLLQFSGAAYRQSERTRDPERRSEWADKARRAAGAVGLEAAKQLARDVVKQLPAGLG